MENGTHYTYSYPSGEAATHLIPNSISDDNGHSVSITSENNQIVDVRKGNVKTSPVYNSSGQIEGYNVKSLDETETYFTTSTSFGHFYQYLASSTNEYGQTTNYYTNVVNGLLEHIRNSNGVITNYEYYDDGMLKKVYIDNSYSNGTTYVEYLYDEFNRLNEINLGENYSYFVHYDSLGRIDAVQVNNQTLISYDYLVDTYETGMISSQTYANGDAIYFQYDEETNNISNILFRSSGMTPVVRFQYEYDSLGRISVYHDLLSDSEEKYDYDNEGNLTQVSFSTGDQIEYGYDDQGNPNAINFTISGSSWSTSYDYLESVSDPSLYDETSFNYSSTTMFYKDYLYQEAGFDDPLGRLQQVQYLSSQNGSESVRYNMFFGYSSDLTRISSISFQFIDYPGRGFAYLYTYDGLGNIISETYQAINPATNLLTNVVTKEYLYDDINQLVQELVYDTRVDCSLIESIESCYIKTFDYDTRGNITSKKTFKYFSTDKHVIENSAPIPVAYEENSGSSNMFVYYDTNHLYNTTLYTDLGESISLSFIYYDSEAFPLQRVAKVFTNVDLSGVDINTPGIYLIECHAYNITEEYILDFGIVVNVGNVIYGELVKETSFQYNSSWLDKLDSFSFVVNGQPTTSQISYDLQGNPTSISNFFYFDGVTGEYYDHAVLSWDGRQLTNIQIFSDVTTKKAEIWYSYNDKGLRVSKCIDTDGNGTQNKRFEYVWSGQQVVSEIVKNFSGGNWIEEYQINYIIDYDGSLIGFKYCVGSSVSNYFYVTNLQGDVTKIISYSGYVYVEYFYDAYGNVISISGPSANSIGKYNSFRYRSYMYDTEINMYYLTSRYFNPQIGRFINSDGIMGEVGDILSSNMFAYCENNPVMFSDPSGYILDTILDVGFILLDIYILFSHHGYRDWRNWVALGTDILFAAIPFVTGGGQFVKLVDVGDDLSDFSKVTVIGESMRRVETVSQFVNASDNIYGGFKAYDRLKDIKHGGKILADVFGKSSNIIWLYGKLRSGYRVVDIGIDSTRLIRSSSYFVEKVFVGVWKTRNAWKAVLHYDFFRG
jgi:RHS repeat-associated protein